jgi:Transposase IS116/IS110/IS902 family/Fatty acid desaturase
VLEDDREPDYLRRQVLTSRNVRGSRLVDFALGGLNYQIEHHLFPSMPRPNLRRAQPLIRGFCQEHDIDYSEATMFGSYAQAVRHLHAVGAPLRSAVAEWQQSSAGQDHLPAQAGHHTRRHRWPPRILPRPVAARLARWFQRQTRKAWGERRADAVVSAAEATLALWGPTGLDYEALAADIATEASLALELSRQIARLDERIFDYYCDADPDHILLSVPGVGKILAGQIRGRVGDPRRFTSLAAARSFSGLIPHQHSSGLTDATGGPTKQGDACLREALFLVADRAPQDRPHPCRPLPAAHVPDRPPPHLGAVHHRHRAAHPDRCLSA